VVFTKFPLDPIIKPPKSRGNADQMPMILQLPKEIKVAEELDPRPLLLEF